MLSILWLFNARLPHLPGSYYPVRKRLDFEEGKIKKQKDGLILPVSLGSLWMTADCSNIQQLPVIDHDPGNILGVSPKAGPSFGCRQFNWS